MQGLKGTTHSFWSSSTPDSNPNLPCNNSTTLNLQCTHPTPTFQQVPNKPTEASNILGLELSARSVHTPGALSGRSCGSRPAPDARRGHLPPFPNLRRKARRARSGDDSPLRAPRQTARSQNFTKSSSRTVHMDPAAHRPEQMVLLRQSGCLNARLGRLYWHSMLPAWFWLLLV